MSLIILISRHEKLIPISTAKNKPITSSYTTHISWYVMIQMAVIIINRGHNVPRKSPWSGILSAFREG